MAIINSILKFDKVCVSYTKQTMAVKYVSADIERNTITSIMGPSGCGKSTLLRAVNISGAVSPITLDTASSIPVNIPPNADGSRTLSVTLALLPPSASPASLRDVGRIFIVSSVDLIISGSIIMNSAALPAIAEYPFIGITTHI